MSGEQIHIINRNQFSSLFSNLDVRRQMLDGTHQQARIATQQLIDTKQQKINLCRKLINALENGMDRLKQKKDNEAAETLAQILVVRTAIIKSLIQDANEKVEQMQFNAALAMVRIEQSAAALIGERLELADEKKQDETIEQANQKFQIAKLVAQRAYMEAKGKLKSYVSNNGANMNQREEDYLTKLLYLAVNGDLEAIKAGIKSEPTKHLIARTKCDLLLSEILITDDQRLGQIERYRLIEDLRSELQDRTKQYELSICQAVKETCYHEVSGDVLSVITDSLVDDGKGTHQFFNQTKIMENLPSDAEKNPARLSYNQLWSHYIPEEKSSILNNSNNGIKNLDREMRSYAAAALVVAVEDYLAPKSASCCIFGWSSRLQRIVTGHWNRHHLDWARKMTQKHGRSEDILERDEFSGQDLINLY